MANRYALLIGTSEYHDERLARLKTPAADLDALAKLLEDRDIGDYQVKVLLNQLFTTVLKEIVGFLKDRHRDDHLLLYFSGHGVLDEGGNLYLATKDTERDLLSATALSNRFIKDEMDRSRSKRQVLILDCCHSGAFLKGTKGAGPALTQATFEGYGRAVLTAADSVQFALEGDQVNESLELSLFTHFLVEGIQTGEADRGNDGWIELDEWFDYAFRKVRDQTENQTPRKFIDNQYGELYIARNPKASVIKPAELPERLRARIKSEYKPDRLEAIQELGGLLDSDDPSMVATAQIALEKIAVEDDSLSIRNNAAELLRQSTERQETRKAEEERRALQQAEAERLAALKAEEERRSHAKAEADRLAALKAEEKRLARERAEAKKQAEVERLAALKAETARRAALQAEQESLARQEADAQRKEEEERLSQEKVRAEHQAVQPAKAELMTGEAAGLEQPAEEERGAQSPGDTKRLGGLPRWAIWIGLVLVGGLIVGSIVSRQANQASVAGPTAIQEAVVTIAPTISLSAKATPAQPMFTSPGFVLGTNTPLPAVSTVESNGAAVQSAAATGRIAFVSGEGIDLMNSDGSGRNQLTKDSAQYGDLTWSPNGERLAFYSDLDSDFFEVYMMNADGSGLIRLTFQGGRDPAWSPDGTRLAFSTGDISRANPDGSGEIYVVNADGSGLTRLTNNFRIDGSPTWSPDGKHIAFASAVVGFYDDIYVMNADGSELIRLTNNSEPDVPLTWLPDGTRIAFISNLDGDSELYVMNAGGSGLTQLTNNSASDYDFAWSSDGKRVAFVSNRDGNDEIYVMNADGSEQTRLTSNSASDYSPAWSPDGTRIVYVSNVQCSLNCILNDFEIYVMNADGSEQTQLTDDWVGSDDPAWQP